MANSDFNGAIYALSQVAEQFKNARILDPSEYAVIHTALWGLVVEREKHYAKNREAEEAARCL